MTVPTGDGPKFQRAAQGALVAVYSPEFEARLAQFITSYASDPKIAASWSERDPHVIAEAERSHFTSAIGVSTYDGPGALYFKIAKHNIAFEGRTAADGGRTIPMNRFALPGRTSGELASILAHEVSHAAGYGHPHSDQDLERAFCEPPYVIGTIVQQLVEGPDWQWSAAGECKCLASPTTHQGCVP